MRLPLSIAQRIHALSESFCGSFTVDTDGVGSWKIAITEHMREKHPQEWCILERVKAKTQGAGELTEKYK